MLRFILLLAFLTSGLVAKPNLLIMTVDDMSADSIGAFGCKLPGTTPHLDKLAERSLRFNHAHVVVGNCMPSRNVMWSGKYPHNNRIEGFKSITKETKEYPVLGELLKDGGWFTGIYHKVEHSTPYAPFPWDMVLSARGKTDTKDPKSYRQATEDGIAGAKQAGKPFCLMLNIADPHKPFYSEVKRGADTSDPNVPSRVFTANEIAVPGFLPDDPIVRKELALYYSTVRRADDAVGEILSALKASGEEEETIILFLSDHGMPPPFAKTQLYHHSSRTPLMVRWPGVTKVGAVDETHLISTVDLLPTILDMVGIPQPGGFDGSSFAGVLKGETQPQRTMVFKEHNENSGGQNTPMRAVQTKDWLYIFNPTSNGSRIMTGATNGTATCRQMRVLAKTDEQVAARIDLFDHRRPEEAYEVRYDPDALTNLIDKPEHSTQVADLEKALEDWMVRTGDPLLEVFRKRDDPAFREQFMKTLEGKRTNRSERKAANRQAKSPSLIQLEVPKTLKAGEPVTVKLKHNFPSDIGEKPVQITLKSGDNTRLERKEVIASGEGTKEITFTIPAGTKSVIFAALVGKSIKDTLQHLQTKAMKVE